jgi:diguanylate cyclase (GGDEF)-like protein
MRKRHANDCTPFISDRDTAHSPVSAALLSWTARWPEAASNDLTASTQGIAAPLMSSLHHLFGRLTEPRVLFPLIGLFFLAVIWGSTFGILRVKHADAERAAAVSSRELLGTYEAQVVRALYEIDHTLNLVKYWHERGPKIRLAELRENGLLPPDLLFAVSIADSEGAVVDSTRPVAGQNVGSQDYFRQRRDNDRFFIGQLPRGPTGDAKLQFSRRLNTLQGAFDGVAIVAVDADYFVSGYEASKLGEHGVLGLLGTDGIFRVRRTGDAVHSGDAVAYASLVPGPEAAEAEATVTTSSWDGVRRYTSARELYGFPLAVLVGLSADEQLTATQRDRGVYFWWATLASALLLPILVILDMVTWRLAQSRLREGELKLKLSQRIEYLAYHDGLTGLPNRSMFSKLLTQSISEARRHDRLLAVAFLDLDRFKQINDTLGHEAGDQLLLEVASRLRACVRDSDTVARLGGDEFVVLLPTLTDQKYAAKVAHKILTTIAAPFTLIGHEFRVTASIGISMFPQDGANEQALTKNADIAMYQAKEEGKNNFQFYSEKLNAHSLERLTLESSLRHALERKEFLLHYQARRDIASGRITGIEALLRWQHPDLGTVAPMRFIPVAEETGLIVPIGKWVLRTACLQNVAWQKQGLPRLSIAVNLTARQFAEEHLLEDLRLILTATGMEPHLLELEITESMLIHDIEKTRRVLTALKALGVRIAIDDFGAGYISLATLQRAPLDTIKIDRSLIRDIASNKQDAGLADAIIAMGKSLSLTVVAQGVETRDQAEFLRTHACDEVQGFYFKRPLPADQFTKLLLAQATDITYIGERAALTNA